MPSKKQLLDKIKENDYEWFSSNYYGSNRYSLSEYNIEFVDETKTIDYDNEINYYVTYYFKNHNIYVTLEGYSTGSSFEEEYDSPIWTTIYQVEPIQEIKTLYKKIKEENK